MYADTNESGQNRLEWLEILKMLWSDTPYLQNEFGDPGSKIAPNTGANATKFFTLATRSWKIVAKLATKISNHTLPRDPVIVEDL